MITLWMGSPDVGAVEAITIGEGGQVSWLGAREASTFVSVRSEKIWMWDVTADGNLARGIDERGGGVYDVLPLAALTSSTGLESERPEQLPAGAAVVDGDGTTYYDPDLLPLIDRLSPLIVDLGAAFRVNRLRIYPRLDNINRNRFLQEFAVFGTTDGSLTRLTQFQAPSENAEPVVDEVFEARDVRYLVLQPLANRPWEVAEIEVFGDGSVPIGIFESLPLPATQSDPVWGRVQVETEQDSTASGLMDAATANVVIQTRSGPDPSPMLYYMLKGDELIPVTKLVWEGALEGLKGPVDPNPEWSPWETVTDGLVRSPSLSRYLQFRIALPEPGTTLRRLHFEYSFPPIARDLAAEIHPVIVEPGLMTPFSLSLQALLKTSGSEDRRDTGFRQLQVRTSAEIGEVRRVRLDDEEVFATTRYEPGQGFTINLWQRLVQNGSFLQIDFTAAVLRERTRFELRAVDRRTDESEGDSTGARTIAYQVARAADVDLTTPGGSLTVRLAGGESLPLIANLATSAVMTPNGDGVRDHFGLQFSLLKLISPARVRLEIYDLQGRLIRRPYEADHLNGNLTLRWDGRDRSGRRVPPGLYIYRLHVEADAGAAVRQGTLGVVY